MNFVVQEDKTGCALASVAALAGVSYRGVKREAQKMGIDVRDPRLWSDTTPVRRLLKRFRISAGGSERRFQSWKALPKTALLALKWHQEGGRSCWHWAVFVRRGDKACVLDSKKALRKHRRRDFGRMKPKWYIPILGA